MKKKNKRAMVAYYSDILFNTFRNIDMAHFIPLDNKLQKLVVGIEPIQAGSGYPSHDNVRPISGRASVNVNVSPTLNPLDGTITNIPLGQTVYGGTLDVLTGVLTVDRAFVANNSKATKYETADGYYWYTTSLELVTPAISGLNAKLISDRLTPVINVTSTSSEGVISWYDNKIIRWKEQGELSQADYRTYLASNPLQLCYELAIPQTIQLTPQQINTIIGSWNYIWCDSGKIIEIEG